MLKNIYYKQADGKEQGPVNSRELSELIQNPVFQQAAQIKLHKTGTWQLASLFDPEDFAESSTVDKPVELILMQNAAHFPDLVNSFLNAKSTGNEIKHALHSL